MELMRSTWTDSRLDDLNRRVEGIREDVRDLRGEMRDLRGEMGDLRGEMHTEFRAVRSEVGDLKRTILQIGWSLVGTLLVGMLGLIGTQI